MAAVTIAVSCADDGNDGASGGNGNGGAVKYELSDVVKVFGFDGQNRYAYCPSVMATDDMTHMWFCGNPDENVFVDNIYHVTVASDGTVSAPVSVLQPGGPGEWDSQHVCDPSVVRGEFAYDGHTYSYAMFYLGSSLECYYNEIGVALADDPDATVTGSCSRTARSMSIIRSARHLPTLNRPTECMRSGHMIFTGEP